MLPNADICYRALESHDARFDGAFFVGVKSTGIYCRTVCTARTPHRRHCHFFRSPAAAETAGYRPCLRCRPELAPGLSPVDAPRRLAVAAAERIESGTLAEIGLPGLAEDLGISARHLRRIVSQEYGVTPIQLAQTHRLLTAKRLLTETALPVIDIAFASGFSSLRRFNALFRQRYRMNPTQLRSGTQHPKQKSDFIRCQLAYRPPFEWTEILRFLAERQIQGVEAIDTNRYQRTVCLGNSRGWLAVEASANGHALEVTISTSLLSVLRPILARLKNLFDLSAEPVAIARHLGKLAKDRPGLRVPGAFDGFELAVRAILGQQISVTGAKTLAGRLATAFGEPAETPYPALTHYSPTADRLATAEPVELSALGILPSRSRSLIALASQVTAGRISLDSRMASPESTIRQLQELPGIGEWTAQYIAMRALRWPDAFPHTDLIVTKVLGTKKRTDLLSIAERWRPWRAYATMHLWQSQADGPSL